MEKDKLIDKLTFYEGFLHSFTQKADNILKDNDIQHLRLVREYIIEAKKHLRGI